MRVAGYVRVSTQEQAKEGYSIGAQTERLKDYCRAREWTLCGIYTDPGYSGAKLDRPALKQLIKDVKAHNIDLVLVYKLDRLSRSQKDTLWLIEEVFIKNDVAFVSLNENFDTSTAFGRAMVGILSVFAQLEREQIKERSQMGRIERAKDGLWRGGGYSPIGYNYDETTGQLLLDEYEAMQVREVYDMFVNKQYAITKITDIMHEKGYTNRYGNWLYSSTARNMLLNPLYAGKIVWHGEVYDGQHTAIISQELFDLAQQRLEKISKKDISYFSATQMLTGIIYCKNCGARYFGSGGYRGSKKLPNNQKTYIHVYTCYSRAKTKKEMIKDPTCKNKRWRAEELDQIVIDRILLLKANPNYFYEIVRDSSRPNDTDAKRDTIVKRLSDIDVQIGKLLDLYQYQTIPANAIAERMAALDSEKTSLSLELECLEGNTPELTYHQVQDILADAEEVFDSGTVDEKRQLVQCLISRIDILENDITISWRFT